MIQRIEDYGMIGDLHTAALVSRDGSLDWLCLPRFDAPACFAALLGGVENGRWLLAPDGGGREVHRRYLDDTLILESVHTTADGTVAVIDFMPHSGPRDRTDLIRIVEGRSGQVAMRTEIVLRFDYGRVVPWVKRADDGMSAIAGPDALRIRTPVTLRGQGFRTTGEFTVGARDRVPFVLTRFRSHQAPPEHIDAERQLEETERWWREWAARCTYDGPWREAVIRSLITLKGLIYNPTGGIVAAPTTSLPEQIGGARNWDYRYCWVRDATFTLYALLISGFRDEARAWREWLLRSAAGAPSQLQPVYGVAGERSLIETQLPWLHGFAGSSPVRIGNGASDQFQLDVYGELMDMLHLARAYEIDPEDDAWALQQALLEFLETKWREPDRGLWEMRGPPHHFTHSKVMAWVAMDRAVKAVTRFGLEGPVERWRALRATIHDDVCRQGFDEKRNTFVQYYGGTALDGALLMMPLVGFLPATDPRMIGTIAAIQQQLVHDGLVYRYRSDDGIDGLVGAEGAFLACSFWLVDNLALIGRSVEARQTFERLLELRNDLGLLSEEFDPRSERLIGNFPQALSHIALINSAYNLMPGHVPLRANHSGQPSS